MPLMAQVFPAHLLLAGKRCLVVGGGRIAARKVGELLTAGAEVTVVAPSISTELDCLQIDKVSRPYVSGDVDGNWLVIAATNDSATNERIYLDCEERGVWVNSVDDPEHCSYITPAIARQGTITVSISTGGRSPAFASWLRKRIEAEIGPEYLQLLDELEALREQIRENGASTESHDWTPMIERRMNELRSTDVSASDTGLRRPPVPREPDDR